METAWKIWKSWENLHDSFAESFPRAAIASIGWDLKYAIIKHIDDNFLTRSWIIYGWYGKPLVWGITLFVVTNILFLKEEQKLLVKSEKVRRFISILIFEFLSLLPMFTVLSCDGARVAFYWIVTTMIIYFSVPSRQLEESFPIFLMRYVEKIQMRIVGGVARPIALAMLPLLAISQNYTDVLGAFYSSVIGTYVYAIVKTMDFFL